MRKSEDSSEDRSEDRSEAGSEAGSIDGSEMAARMAAKVVAKTGSEDSNEDANEAGSGYTTCLLRMSSRIECTDMLQRCASTDNLSIHACVDEQGVKAARPFVHAGCGRSRLGIRCQRAHAEGRGRGTAG